jgi:GcrA cell cycle regulator
MTAGISYGSPRGAGSLGDASATGRSSPRITGEMKPWTPEDDEALRTLWAAGLSTSKIGEQLSRTKNSVVGRSHRLDLPARESPIIRDGRAPKDGRPAYVRPPRVTLPPLASQVGDTAVVQFALPLAVLRPVIAASRPLPAVKAPVVVLPVVRSTPAEPTPRPYARTAQCCWPIGEPGTSSFRFCEALHENRTYCDEHHRIAYVRIRSWREMAAQAAD